MTINKKLLDYFNGDEMAASVWKDKYAAEGEEIPDQMHMRMAKEFARIEERYQKEERDDPSILSKLSPYGYERMPLCEQSIYGMFKDFKYIVPQGSIMASLGTNKIASLSNCFVIGQPHDSYSGILGKDEELVQLMKRRGGVGIDISTLRPNGTSVTNAAKTSTGAVSFMDRYSNSTREVSQNGRRGALMITIDCRHPDVLDFINSKQDRTKITGANISVMLRDDFMKAVEKDEDYILRWPCNIIEDRCQQVFHLLTYDNLFSDKGQYFKKIRAKNYYNAIVQNAKDNAEPGQIFIDKHWNYSPDGVYDQYKGVTTNPCGEIFMQKYDACRLIALNLFSVVKNPFQESSEIDYDLLYKISYEQQRLSDDLVDLELESINKIVHKILDSNNPTQVEFELWDKIDYQCRSGRRTGNGITALGDMLAALNLKYDSHEALEVIDKVFKTKMEAELDCTIDLAILRGTFKGWDSYKEYEDNGTEFNLARGKNDFYEMLINEFPKQVERMLIHGRRNVSFSTVAPTGTVSLMTATSSGLEPLFKAYYIRRRKINPNEKDKRVDFVDQNGDSWTEYPVLHPKFKDWMYALSYDDDYINNATKKSLKEIFEESPWYGSEANDINWKRRIEIQSVIQKYITHSISSTLNLPATVSAKEVEDIYMYAWEKGLKGCTIYVEGSRSGVLIEDKAEKAEEFHQHDAPKRPKLLRCDVHLTSKQGKEYLVAVGLYDGKPYEVFACENQWNISGHLTGDIIKIRRCCYDIQIKDDLLIENITNTNMSPEEEDLTRFVSMSLRHGSSIQFVVEQLNKTKSLTSLSKCIARALKKYIPEGGKVSGGCEHCGGELIYEEGCQKCSQCQVSKC